MPENRDELKLELDNAIPLHSSRFSGQTSRIYTGIPKKDISMFHAKKDIAVLLAIVSFLGEIFSQAQMLIIVIVSQETCSELSTL
jgi:hypothetical protein